MLDFLLLYHHLSSTYDIKARLRWLRVEASAIEGEPKSCRGRRLGMKSGREDDTVQDLIIQVVDKGFNAGGKITSGDAVVELEVGEEGTNGGAGKGIVELALLTHQENTLVSSGV